MKKKEIVLPGMLLEAGEYSAREGSTGKAGPAVRVVIGGRRCLVPLPEAAMQELLATVKLYSEVELVIRIK